MSAFVVPAGVGAGARLPASEFGGCRGPLHHPALSLSRGRGGGGAPRMALQTLEFQTFSGGLDRVSQEPYAITRYLFKNSPAALTEQDKDVAVQTALRQVFGNAYLMEEEREEVYVPESKFRCGEITAKEFVRALAKSSTYKKRFFDPVSQYRFIELNHKHLLGRAPLDKVDYSKHFKVFAAGGYEAEIDSYLDDGEYDDVFGEDTVPYTRFRGTYAPINQFNRMCTLEGGFAGSDKFKPQMLTTSLLANRPTTPHSIVDGLPPIPNAEHPSKKYNLPSVSLERFRNELEVAKAKASELQRDLEAAYSNYESSRDFLGPFKNMVKDIELNPLYGKDFGNGAVQVFSGQYIGTPAAEWGKTGTETVRGRTRRVGFDVGAKEKRLEGLKQLIVDIERKIAVLAAELDAPALTPAPVEFRLPGLEEVAPPAPPAEEEAKEAEEEDVTKKVEIVTSRDLETVGPTPKEILKEIEEEKKAAGKGPSKGRGLPTYPGDGSEMVIGS